VAKGSGRQDEIIAFVRKRDYKLIKELGQGACGKTVLLFDDQIGEYFVCKKYQPLSEIHRQELFEGFVKEIKLLHIVYHKNIVRVFNHYIYPDQLAGYILMEFVDGLEIDKYLSHYPEQTNDVFLQTISGFAYLQRRGILHRDIRPGNVMVNADSDVKIIDLGFGKQIQNSDDFDKSISLNWWCQPPSEFAYSRYDFRTEVYFVGKLFERIIKENEINHFKYASVLGRMCLLDPLERIQAFSGVEKEIRSDQFFEIEFSESELYVYRAFSAALVNQITKIEHTSQYEEDIERVISKLNDSYRGFMLEEKVPDAAVVTRCLLTGTYYYTKRGLPVSAVRDFLLLMKSSTEEKNRIIISNLYRTLDTLPRYNKALEDEIPF